MPQPTQPTQLREPPQPHDEAPRDRRRQRYEAAALALLLEAPCHGYMLHRRFVELLGDAPAPRKQTIYDVIDRLGRADLIVAEIEPAADQWRQARRKLIVTAAGRARVAAFAAGGISGAEDREEFGVRVRCAGALRELDALQQALAARTTELLARQQRLPPIEPEVPAEPVLLTRHLLQRRELLELQSELEWLEWAQALVAAAAAGTANA